MRMLLVTVLTVAAIGCGSDAGTSYVQSDTSDAADSQDVGIADAPGADGATDTNLSDTPALEDVLTDTETGEETDGTLPPLCPLEDWVVQCGYDIEPVLRTEWGEPLKTQNHGLDVSTVTLVAAAIADGVYPPHNEDLVTTGWPDSYAVGGILGWGWEDLEWEPESQEPDTLVVHYTAGDHAGDCAVYVRSVANLHTFTNGWGDIGYNFIVCEDGNGVQTFEGRWSGAVGIDYDPWSSIQTVGAHSRPNTGTVGISLTLGVGRSPSETEFEHYLQTVAQVALRTENTISSENIRGHSDREEERGGSTECPGELYPLLDEIRDRVRDCQICCAQ